MISATISLIIWSFLKIRDLYKEDAGEWDDLY